MEHVSTKQELLTADIGAEPQWEFIAVFECRSCRRRESKAFDPNALRTGRSTSRRPTNGSSLS